MIIVEYWSGIMGFIEGYALYRFLQGDVKKSFNISMTVGCMQFYACTAFFGTEVLVDFANIKPDFFSFYVKFWGLNGFWMIMPMLSTYCYLKVMADPAYDVKAVLNQYFKKTP
jgi:Na+-driven multidrug efflux pump